MSVRRIEDPGGALLKVTDYNGHLVQPFPNVGSRLDALSRLPVRDDDVLVTGYPKSGSHWAWEICHRLLTNNAGSCEESLGLFMLEGQDESFLSTHPSPRVFFSHLPTTLLRRSEQLIKKGRKIVYVLRNPKDVAVSYYIQSYSCRVLYEYDGDWKDYFQLFLRGEVDSGSWFDHVLDWEQFKLGHPELQILFIFYEDLSKNLMGEIRKLASFLGVEKDDTFLQQLYEVTQFAAMKKNHDDHASDVLKGLYRDGGAMTMFRKGVVGGWKTTFTVDQSERMDSMFADRMKHSKIVFPFKQKT